MNTYLRLIKSCDKDRITHFINQFDDFLTFYQDLSGNYEDCYDFVDQFYEHYGDELEVAYLQLAPYLDEEW